MQRPIFYDTETTGIRVDKERIIEIAAFDPVRGCTFEGLINPGIPIPPDATAIHKISDAMVAEAPTFAQVAQDFVTFCEGDVVLIAHNNDSFDYPILRNEFIRHQMELPAWKFLDSLKWARRYRSDLPRHTLQFLREIYGIAANNAHRALDDVKVLHQVFELMTDNLEIEQIMTLLNRPKEIIHMPFGKHQGKPLQHLPKDYIQWLCTSGALDKADNQDLRNSFEKLKLMPSSS